MGEMLEAFLAMGLTLFVILAIITICIVIVVVYYGAILFVILLILEHFGILTALGI